jgi:hypothetical protein
MLQSSLITLFLLFLLLVILLFLPSIYLNISKPKVRYTFVTVYCERLFGRLVGNRDFIAIIWLPAQTQF